MSVAAEHTPFLGGKHLIALRHKRGRVQHRDGTSSFAAVAKARFFRALGFSSDQWEALAAALRAQASGARVSEEPSPWGTKYVATGEIDAPNGQRYKISSVWIDDGAGPRLVTAYPYKD